MFTRYPLKPVIHVQYMGCNTMFHTDVVTNFRIMLKKKIFLLHKMSFRVYERSEALIKLQMQLKNSIVHISSIYRAAQSASPSPGIPVRRDLAYW